VAAIRDHIAHKERARKTQDISLSELRANWDRQLTVEEKALLGRLATQQVATSASSEGLAEQAVSWAEDHLFARRSVVLEHELWRQALEHVRGQNVGLADIQVVTRQRGYLRYQDHPGRVTTREALRREWEIVCLARDGLGRFAPFCPRLRSTTLTGCGATPGGGPHPAVAGFGYAVSGRGRYGQELHVARSVRAHCGKRGAQWKSSPHNGSRSWTWNEMASVAHKPSAPFSPVASCRAAAWW